MLGMKKKKSKLKRGSIRFVGNLSGSVSDVDDRVVMLCEDIPSEGSSWDSGWGSHSSGTRSSSDEQGRGWRSQSFHGREGQSVPRPVKQLSVREVRRVEPSPVSGHNYGGHSSLHIREQYGSAAVVTLCTCFVS